MPRRLILHPFLFAIYPIAALLLVNAREIEWVDAFRPMLVSIIFVSALFVALRFLLKNTYAAAVLASVSVLLFFSYGHVYRLLEGTQSLPLNLGRHRFLAPIWIVLFLALLWIVWRARSLQSFSRLLDLVGLALLLLLGIQLAQSYGDLRPIEAAQTDLPPVGILESGEGRLPDVYFIVLDAYARSDVMQDQFDLDNEDFESALRSKGFFIASCSQSNYAQTELSLASTLNFNYLDSLGSSFTEGSDDRSPLRNLILHSQMRDILETLGYQVVAFETGFSWSQWKDADHYFGAAEGPLEELSLVGRLSGFEALLLQNSAVLIVSDASLKMPQLIRTGLEQPSLIHRDRVEYALEHLADVPQIEGPKFVFVHIVSPHEPYVFDAEGNYVSQADLEERAKSDPDALRQSYHDQVIYLNKRVLENIDELLRQSGPEPIIIIQADHGVDGDAREDRLAIFNAMYLPADGNEVLYETISPVNTFRVILNQYFGFDMPLLSDNSYLSYYQTPFDFIVIPNECGLETSLREIERGLLQ